MQHIGSGLLRDPLTFQGTISPQLSPVKWTNWKLCPFSVHPLIVDADETGKKNVPKKPLPFPHHHHHHHFHHHLNPSRNNGTNQFFFPRIVSLNSPQESSSSSRVCMHEDKTNLHSDCVWTRKSVLYETTFSCSVTTTTFSLSSLYNK